MNTGENHHELHSLISPEIEARIVTWASGESSESESSELSRLAAARPEVAAFKVQVEAMRDLALAAVAPDREPLRLSEERREALMARFSAMRRRNLALAASFSVLLVAGIAWYGEITHAIPPLRRIISDAPQVPFTLDPDPPTPVEVSQAPREAKTEVGPPQIQDTPSKPTITDFTVPIEPPQPVVDITMTQIPIGGGRSMVDRAVNLSQLDEPPAIKYRARPVYPESMRRMGVSGQVTVDFVVDPNGNVRNATAIHSSQREFEEPACTAVSKWTFRPGKLGGRAVFVHMQVPIVFTLNEE